MKQPRSIESNLVSLGIALGSLLVVLLLVLLGVEHALGSRLERLGNATMPAQQAITGLRHEVARLFERQVQVLSTRSEAELEQLKNRQSIERGLVDSQRQLGATLPEIVERSTASGAATRLSERTREVLGSDAALFDSVQRRHSTEAQFDTRTAGLKTSLDQLIQEARAIAGIAHLEYVLELRRVARGASPDKAIHGNARGQQEAAEQVVTSVLQLGQLVGKIGLARNEDELNSIVANELAQNLARSRTALRVLVANVDGETSTAERTLRMQKQFESVAGQISAAKEAQCLVELRRSILVEAGHAAELRSKTQKSASGLSSELDRVERFVADETQSSTRSARRALWVARGLSLAAFLAALAVGFHSARRLRESVSGLRAQNQELESLSSDLTRMNEGLEGLVAERSAALVQRERSMRLVLDAMSEGLVSVDLEGKVVGESSKAALSWFGSAEPDTLIWEYLFGSDEHMKASFRAGYGQIADDILPFEVCIDCMPRRFSRGEQIFSLGYRQVLEEGRFQRVLVVLNDISHQVAAEARERDTREQHQLFSHLIKDKQGLQMFVRESERLIAALRAEPARDRALRLLHTLKGNTAVFGMESVSRHCHELEDALADRSDSLSAAEGKALSDLWRSRLNRVEEVLTREVFVELREDEFGELVSGLRNRRDYPELIELVESWKWVKTSLLLRRLSAQVRRVAERLGKSVDVRVEHNHLRVMPGALEDFWGSLIHVVRNAVDHGLESEEERVARGKPAMGSVVLRTSQLSGSGFCIELSDDGRGIDFNALRAIATQRGVAATSNSELIELMFHDGVTTKEQASEMSGRGVGLGAVVSACRAAGGMVDVDTSEGKGSLFRFAFPDQPVQVREAKGSGTFHSMTPRRSVRASLRSATNT